VDVTGPDGVVWHTVVQLDLHRDFVSVAAQTIGDALEGIPLPIGLYRNRESGKLVEDPSFPWNSAPVSEWRNRLGDQFIKAIEKWEHSATQQRKSQSIGR
jgi:hypothetical protein